jgi:3-methyladenine DNA glycosylase AlkD
VKSALVRGDRSTLPRDTRLEHEEQQMARTSRRSWTADEVVQALNAAADPQIATIYQRRNPAGTVLGVRYGDMEKLVKQIEPDAALAAELWENGAAEARTVAIRVLPRGGLTEAQVDAWVQDLEFPPLADEFAKAVYHTPWARDRMLRWIEDERDFMQRTGWSLMYGFAADPTDTFTETEWKAWLERIAATIHDAPNWSREAMNNLPIAIGLRSPALFDAAIAAANRYGRVSVFHGDKTNCKVNDPVALLNNPRTKVVRY